MADYLDQLLGRGLVSDDVYDRLRAGEPQRQSRFDILRQGLDSARDYLTPDYFRDTPSSPQADRALTDPTARPGKIGPPSGPPTGMQIAGGLAGDVGLNALPLGKMLAAMPFAIAGNPEMMARFRDLVAKGYSRQAIADELGVGKATVGRELNRTNQKTATPAIVGRWGADPDAVDELKAGLAGGESHAYLAEKFGTSKGAVSSKVQRLIDAGEVAPDYTTRHGGQRRMPSMPQLRSLERPTGPAPLNFNDIVRLRNSADPSERKALQDYLRSRGLSALDMPQFG
jgi:hypothetical protein